MERVLYASRLSRISSLHVVEVTFSVTGNCQFLLTLKNTSSMLTQTLFYCAIRHDTSFSSDVKLFITAYT